MTVRQRGSNPCTEKVVGSRGKLASPMRMTTFQRQPHAVRDLPSRNWKAEKVARLLDLVHRPQPMRLLEIGTGSDGIAHRFDTHPSLQCDVTGVHMVDNRLIHDRCNWRQVHGTELPFDDASFDVVITNHVIEHVGDADAQHRHLLEVRRVMKPGGIGYLAVPNRWMLTEPHYKLKFLSWWPHSWRTPYLRMMRKGTFYDCEPPQVRQFEHTLETTGFGHRNLCTRAWRAPFEIERPHLLGVCYLRATLGIALTPLNWTSPLVTCRIALKGVL